VFSLVFNINVMTKWWENIKKVKYSKNNKRFLNSFDMVEAKRAESILNSKIKRGEVKETPHRKHVVCTCGVSGCIMCMILEVKLSVPLFEIF